MNTIRKHLRVRNLPPSRSEIARELGISNVSQVGNLLSSLEKRGWLENYPSVERGVRLLREGAPLYEDPGALLTLDAPPAQRRGLGTNEEPPRVDSFDSFAGLFEERPDLLLRIGDHSLDLAGYPPGVIAVVVRGLEPRDGDVVVARVEDEVLVRRYRRKRSGTAELCPESSNPEHRSVRVRRGSTEVEILGVVVGKIVTERRGGEHEEETAPETD